MYSRNCTLSNDLEKQQLHLFSLIFYLFDADVAVQLPDKKSIIMYLTSLFEVLPKQVTMEDIREVETLPRRYKQECEDGEFNMQQVCLSSKSAWLFLSCNFSWSSGLSVTSGTCLLSWATQLGKYEKSWHLLCDWLKSFCLPFSSFLIHVQNPACWGIKLYLSYTSFFCFSFSFVLTSWRGWSKIFNWVCHRTCGGGDGSDGFLFGCEIHC